jgi:hypothetical protein
LLLTTATPADGNGHSVAQVLMLMLMLMLLGQRLMAAVASHRRRPHWMSY